MVYELVVTQDFKSYKKGDRITDAVTIKSLLQHHAARVVKVAAPAAPSPDAPEPSAPASAALPTLPNATKA